jgi:hypothetical protein
MTFTPFAGFGPLTRVSPFTHRDNATYLRILQELIKYINETLADDWVAELQSFLDQFNAKVTEFETNLNTTEANWQSTYDAFVALMNSAFTVFEGTTNATVAANLATMQAEYTTFTTAINAQVAVINNKSGPIDIQRATLTGTYNVAVNGLWPNNQPVSFVLTQDGTGGRAVTLASYITGPLKVNAAPNGITEFTLVPLGDTVNWKVVQKNAFKAGLISIPNVTPDSEILLALTEAKTAQRGIVAGVRSDPVGTRVIELPAGDITLTQFNALLGREAMTGKVSGLRFKGQGSDITTVIYSPADATQALLLNDYWHNIHFDGITFATTVTGATFMQSYTTHSAQDYTFNDVKWVGPWKYVIDLQGNNNNSELKFYDCATSGMASNGSFIYAGNTNTSDQFLNYWFYGFKHWSTSASIIDMSHGGHIHMFGVDVSDWGTALTATQYIFNLRQNSHSQGVTSLSVNGMRVEAKNALAALLYCEWSQGDIKIECDWSSQTFAYTYGDIIAMSYGNDAGPVVVLTGRYAGGINIKYGISGWVETSSFTVRDAEWKQKKRPSDAVTFVQDGGHSNYFFPSVLFDNVRPDLTYQNLFNANGLSVWNARVGRAPLAVPRPFRAVSLQGVGGGINSNDTLATVNLPVGAIITGFTIFGTPGGNGFTGATWTFQTADATPVTIAAINVNQDLTPGFYRHTDLTVPFACTTAAKASVGLKVSGSLTSSPTYVTIEGAW